MFSCPKRFRFSVDHAHYNLRHFPFSDYRIVQLSDLHLGFGLGTEFLDSIVEKVLTLSPELVVITGDLIETSIANVSDGLTVLGKLSAAVPTYFVPGNHDFEFDPPEKVLSFLESLGIEVLLNRSVWIGGTRGFNLAGVCDPIARIKHMDNIYHPDIDRSLARINAEAPVILLSHRPILRYLEEHNVDLMLSGHLHGGQILPFGLLSIYLYEDSGERISIRDRRIDGRKHLHVCKGIGYTTLPFRFMVKSAISLIVLDPE